jgi:YD repeat-containing protein
MYTNALDAAGRTLASMRVGSDNSLMIMSQSVYDLADELVARTNALGGSTTFIRANDPTTGGLIRMTVNPDGGTVTNYYYADRNLKESVGTGVHGKGYSYGAGADINGNQCSYTIETNINTDGMLSSEWTQTYRNMVQRNTELYYSDGSYSQLLYNAFGQLSKQVDPDGVAILYDYDARGQVAHTAIDVNRNDEIDLSGTDRVTWVTNDVLFDSSLGANVQRARTFAFDVNGSLTPDLISMREASVDGLNMWQTQFRDASTPVTMHNRTVPGILKTVTNTAPDGSYVVGSYSYGRLISKTRFNSAGTQISGTGYSYDPHGRQNAVIDARNGATTYAFNNADQITSVTAPLSETTTTYYNLMMRATNVIQPDATSVISVYLKTGELGEQYGSRTYPVAYSYDYAGRLKSMTNWSNFTGGTGARVTMWTYDSYRGFLTNKTYDGGTQGPSYTYTASGRLASRTWARGVTTSYLYDNGGSMTNIIYSDGTPNVTNTFDRLGRLHTASWTNTTDTLSYNLANQLTGESFSGGILAGLAVTNMYDQSLRRTNLASLNGSTTLAVAVYGYDNASRLSTVSDGTNNAMYYYLANSMLVNNIAFSQNSTVRMTTTKQYDGLDRLTSISSTPTSSGQSALSFGYTYNTANQRTRNTLLDGSYWVYGYDSLGQVTNGVKYWADGTPVAGQQFQSDNSFNTDSTMSATGRRRGAAGTQLERIFERPITPITHSMNSLAGMSRLMWTSKARASSQTM